MLQGHWTFQCYLVCTKWAVAAIKVSFWYGTSPAQFWSRYMTKTTSFIDLYTDTLSNTFRWTFLSGNSLPMNSLRPSKRPVNDWYEKKHKSHKLTPPIQGYCMFHCHGRNKTTSLRKTPIIFRCDELIRSDWNWRVFTKQSIHTVRALTTVRITSMMAQDILFSFLLWIYFRRYSTTICILMQTRPLQLLAMEVIELQVVIRVSPISVGLV